MIEELRDQARALGIQVDGRWKESKLLQVIADASVQNAVSDMGIHHIDEQTISFREDAAPTSVDRTDAMNAYALRLLASQSPVLSRAEVVSRVKEGLVGQGYADILDKLSLPE